VGLAVTRAAAMDRAGVLRAFADGGFAEPSTWGAGPGDPFGWHDHARRKVLFCLRGSIEFWDRSGGSWTLRPVDRLDLEAGTEHRAVAGPEGVECVEAFR
jgi:quercetin dioxygenase-like cupin family protein